MAARPKPAPAPEPKPAPVPEPAPAAASSGGSCPGGMAFIKRKNKEGYCIDRYEYPGRGRMPKRGVAYAAAKKTCQMRGLRLCSVREWMRACSSTYTYGKTYDGARCNTSSGKPVASGKSSKCRSRWGVYDMSGNVSEWVAENYVMGGDAISGEKSGCRSNGRGSGMSGFRCCGDEEW